MSVTVIEHITLDGVMQAPGLPDEDTRGGFRPGGRAMPNLDETVAAAWAQGHRSDARLGRSWPRGSAGECRWHRSCCTGRCRWMGSSPDRDEADAFWASFLREAKSKEELR